MLAEEAIESSGSRYSFMTGWAPGAAKGPAVCHVRRGARNPLMRGGAAGKAMGVRTHLRGVDMIEGVVLKRSAW